MSRPLYDFLAHRDGGYKCRYCKKPLNPHGTDEDTTIDHFVPLSKGGTDHWNNLVLCCHSCNQAKTNKLPEEWCAERGLKLKNIRPQATPPGSSAMLTMFREMQARGESGDD